jgi:hypothetical protein
MHLSRGTISLILVLALFTGAAMIIDRAYKCHRAVHFLIGHPPMLSPPLELGFTDMTKRQHAEWLFVKSNESPRRNKSLQRFFNAFRYHPVSGLYD